MNPLFRVRVGAAISGVRGELFHQRKQQSVRSPKIFFGSVELAHIPEKVAATGHREGISANSVFLAKSCERFRHRQEIEKEKESESVKTRASIGRRIAHATAMRL
jgi:hypothetical protein